MADKLSASGASLPFDHYPHQGQELLDRVSGNNCRQGYGLYFQQLTGQTHCAYCGISLVDVYENWLTMALDHVIPASVCNACGVPEEWKEDYSNRVLCCTACNTFGNRYKLKVTVRPTTLVEFYEFRDKIFLVRRDLILRRHKEERNFFEQKPWALPIKGKLA